MRTLLKQAFSFSAHTPSADEPLVERKPTLEECFEKIEQMKSRIEIDRPIWCPEGFKGSRYRASVRFDHGTSHTNFQGYGMTATEAVHNMLREAKLWP